MAANLSTKKLNLPTIICIVCSFKKSQMVDIYTNKENNNNNKDMTFTLKNS